MHGNRKIIDLRFIPYLFVYNALNYVLENIPKLGERVIHEVSDYNYIMDFL